MTCLANNKTTTNNKIIHYEQRWQQKQQQQQQQASDNIAEEIRGLRNGKSPRPSNVRVENLYDLMKDAYREEHPYHGNWNRVVDLIQTCFRLRQVSTQMSWSTVVLLSNGNGDYIGIGLLEMNWKVIKSIIN